MNNVGKKLEIFIIVTIIALIGIIYAFRQKPAPVPSRQTTTVEPPPPSQVPSLQVPSTQVEYKGVDGKNALELLRNGHRVEVKEYSYGSFVTGIDGITPDANHFWAFYVNGEFSQVAADQYVTKSSDSIKWQMDAIE